MYRLNHAWVLGGAAAAMLGASSQAAVTYVDATEGVGGNTSLAAGGAFTSSSSASGTDNLWRGRAFGNSTTIFEAGGDNSSTGSALNGDNEDAPRLVTTISGLASGTTYAIYAFYWDTTGADDHWGLQASLSNPVGDLSVFVDGPLANTLTFDANPMLSEGNRVLHVASLGNAVADGSGEVQVYIDDHAAPRQGVTDGWQFRNWYDGVGYEVVPEPASVALLGLGGLCVLARRRR